MRPTGLLLSAAALGAAFVAGRLTAAESATKADVRNLLLATLSPEFTPDRQALIDLVQIPPGAKIVVVRVHTKGKPWRYLDDPTSHTH